MTSLYTYLNIKFLPAHHMLHHIMSSYYGYNSETNENTTLLMGIVGKLSTSTI
ncbi:hypothetical protein O3M35_005352 [Rhynocoris fuscipes]|uniref:Uncharacterized protein n=1 Tax=Rhynocoris fuscipes TaxID=488301 RepID=A0AAW1DJB9_9HEMI